jgi:hypothetical protein
VEDRTRLGAWEFDAIIGKGRRQALVSLTERTSRLALIAKEVPKKEAEGVTRAILNLLGHFLSKSRLSQWAREKSFPTTKPSLIHYMGLSILHIRTPPGSVDSTKTPMASFPSTVQRAVIS